MLNIVGIILFGGWTKIFDSVIPSGTRGHELYLAFGGVGAGEVGVANVI